MSCKHSETEWTRSPASIAWIVVLSVLLAPVTLGITLFGMLFILAVPKRKRCLECRMWLVETEKERKIKHPPDMRLWVKLDQVEPEEGEKDQTS